jgi:hypothetical protein
MRTLISSVVLLLLFGGCKQSDPEDVLGRNGDELLFSGRMWDIKQNEFAVGPGPNFFSGFYEDVWVDENGYLHMRIAEHDGKWYASEVVGRDVLGYGTYTWVVQGDLENIPENIVLGLFTWDTDNFLTEANSEVDIEFSKWGDPENPNTLHYSVQPVAFEAYYPERTRAMETPDGSLIGVTTHTFTWTDTLIEWSSYTGDQVAADKRIAYWSFDLDNPPRQKSEGGLLSEPVVIPAPGDATNARINFWILPWVSPAPTDGLEHEVVIRSFTYTPM